jgi:mannose-6-phosphate isomerase-like protein (cupin superfamily)
MKHIDALDQRRWFAVLAKSDAVQAAVMTLQSGQDTGPVQNEHPKCEQWLFVVSGTGQATVGSDHIDLNPGSLLLIEPGEDHQIRNTDQQPLVTVNFYAPPAYTASGDVRPSAR